MEEGGKGKPAGAKGNVGIGGGAWGRDLVGEGGKCFMLRKSAPALLSNLALMAEAPLFFSSSCKQIIFSQFFLTSWAC